MTEQEFTTLVSKHDLSYWNANVDRKMRAGCRSEYYWSVPVKISEGAD